MSYAEAPAPTEAQQILAELAKVNDRLDILTSAFNGQGENVKWIVDNVKHIFQMFGSPQFMAMLGNLNFGGMTANDSADTASDSPGF